MATSDRSRLGPLDGLRVVDLSTVLAGPFCTMLLGDLGADVVKVEPPEGDATRGWGPPWVGDAGAGTQTAAYFLAVNRNKRSLRLDLKRPAGREVLTRLLADANVVVENYRVGGFARLGFPDAELVRINPRLVHLAISGAGPDGPDRDRPGYDFVAQAIGGLMSITGAPAGLGGGPTKVGVAISDVATGLFGAVGILAALVGRPAGAADGTRETVDRTGGRIDATRGADAAQGQRIDVSLLESTLAILVNQAQNAFVTGVAPGRRGNAHPNIVPYETFETLDGAIAVAVGSERQWGRLCTAIGLPALADDPRFATNGGRVEARDELIPTLGARFAERPSQEWLAALDAAGIPCGPINDVVEAFAAPQAVARGLRTTVDHPTLGPIAQVGPPFELSRTPASIRSAPPLLGEHADEILTTAGYSAADIEALRRDGVI